MVKNISIQMLKEIMVKNNYSRTKMAALCDVSVETYSRWMKGESFTRSVNTLKQIEKVVSEHYKAS